MASENEAPHREAEYDAGMVARMIECGLGDLVHDFHCNGVSTLRELGALDEPMMVRLGIAKDNPGTRSRIMSRLATKPRDDNTADTVALCSARAAEEVSRDAVIRTYSLDEHTITPQSLPPHPIYDLRSGHKRIEKARLEKHQLETVEQLAEGAQMKRDAYKRQVNAEVLREESVQRVWQSRKHTKGLALCAIAKVVLHIWVLRDRERMYKRWYLAMRCEGGALRLLRFLVRFHREWIREVLLFLWRVCAAEARRLAELEYKEKRSKRSGPRRR